MFREIENFATDLGGIVITLAVVMALIWICVKIPLLGWITLQLLMAAWFLVAIGGALFVAWLQFDDGEVLGGLGALVGGALLGIPWVFAAREFYPAQFPPKPEHLKLWS